MHPDGIRIATGEVGAKPSIFLWSAETCEAIQEFKVYYYPATTYILKQ